MRQAPPPPPPPHAPRGAAPRRGWPRPPPAPRHPRAPPPPCGRGPPRPPVQAPARSAKPLLFARSHMRAGVQHEIRNAERLAPVQLIDEPRERPVRDRPLGSAEVDEVA